MLTEPMTLYKLMNLYMLKQVNFPLSNAQLTSFFTEHEYTTYFTLQQALNELEESCYRAVRQLTLPGYFLADSSNHPMYKVWVLTKA